MAGSSEDGLLRAGQPLGRHRDESPSEKLGPWTKRARRAALQGQGEPVVVRCSNGDVAMSAEEFETFLESGNILRSLVYGRDNMREECKLDIFLRFSVTAEIVNVIRACIRGQGALPVDAAVRQMVESGDLRHWSDAIGGFPAVDEALRAYEARQTDLSRGAEMERRRRTACSPATDEAELYDWRVVSHFGTVTIQDQIEQLQAENFLWASSEGRNNTRLAFFRRPRLPLIPKTAASEGGVPLGRIGE